MGLGRDPGRGREMRFWWVPRRDPSLPVPWGKEWQNQKPQTGEGFKFQGTCAFPHGGAGSGVEMAAQRELEVALQKVSDSRGRI